MIPLPRLPTALSLCLPQPCPATRVCCLQHVQAHRSAPQSWSWPWGSLKLTSPRWEGYYAARGTSAGLHAPSVSPCAGSQLFSRRRGNCQCPHQREAPRGQHKAFTVLSNVRPWPTMSQIPGERRQHSTSRLGPFHTAAPGTIRTDGPLCEPSCSHHLLNDLGHGLTSGVFPRTGERAARREQPSSTRHSTGPT